MLREQASDDSSQNVSRAARCHARIPGRIHPDRAIGRGDQRAMSFEHDDQFMLAGKVSRDIQAIGLNFGNAQARQARHFSRMRSNDQGSSAAVQLVRRSFESIQRIGIYHHVGNRTRNHLQSNSPRVPPRVTMLRTKSAVSELREIPGPIASVLRSSSASSSDSERSRGNVPSSVSASGSVISSG
jgi:hypothetical protein